MLSLCPGCYFLRCSRGRGDWQSSCSSRCGQTDEASLAPAPGRRLWPLRRHGGCLPAGHSASTAGETSGRPSPESSLFTQHLWRPAAKVRLRRNELVWGSALAPRQEQGSAGRGGGRGYNLAIGVSSQHQAKNVTRSSARLPGLGETSAKETPGAGTWLQGPGSGMWHGLWASHCPGVFAAAQPLLVSRWSSVSCCHFLFLSDSGCRNSFPFVPWSLLTQQ